MKAKLRSIGLGVPAVMRSLGVGGFLFLGFLLLLLLLVVVLVAVVVVVAYSWYVRTNSVYR